MEITLASLGPYWKVVKAVLCVLPEDPEGALTYRDMAERTGYSYSTTRNAMLAARHAGLIASAGQRPRRGRGEVPTQWVRTTAGRP